MTAAGVVTDAVPGRVEIELAPRAACRGCRGLCLWRIGERSAHLSLATPSRWCAGDAVSVSLSERYVLEAAVLLHGLPLAALVIGALAGHYLGSSDIAAVAGACVAVTLALAVTPKLRRRLERKVVASLRIERRADG